MKKDIKKNQKPKKHLGDLNNEGVNYVVKKARQKAAVTAVAITCVIIFFIAAGNLIFNSDNVEKPVAPPNPERPIMRILFVGNSYTSFNNMPEILKNIALYDPSAQVKIHTEQYTINGARLSTLWNAPERQQYLKNKVWDFVILQPNSLWATTKSTADETDRSLQIWLQAASAAGAMPVFMMTWPRQYGSNWYVTHKKQIGGPAEMYQNLHNRTQYLVKKYNLLEIPAGKYWAYAATHYKTINLYTEDGSHPSVQGSFLLALLIYKTLVDKTLKDIGYMPEGITEQQKTMLIDLATTSLDEK